jgi:ATP-dependent Lon protease
VVLRHSGKDWRSEAGDLRNPQPPNLAEVLQVAFDSGAKRILLPTSSIGGIQTIPGELFAKFQTSFYSDPVDAAFKALGVE